MADADLTLPATVATELAGGVLAADPRLPRLILVASAAIASYLDRAQLHYSAAITEKVKAYGRPRLVLDVTPIVAITSITLDDGSVVSSSDYAIENANAGFLYRRAGWASTGLARGGLPPGNDLAPGTEESSITVVYGGGWVCPAQSGTRNMPYDIEEACIQTVVSLYRGNGRDPSVASEGLGDYSVSYRGGINPAGIIPANVIAMLDKYRRPLG